jgi:hypothetical protein
VSKSIDKVNMRAGTYYTLCSKQTIVQLSLYRKLETFIPRNETVRPPSQFLQSCICDDLYIPMIGPRQTDPGNIQIAHRCRNVEIRRQNIIILFWKQQGRTVSFLGIHKSVPDICIGFSPAFHLQCGEQVRGTNRTGNEMYREQVGFSSWYLKHDSL